MPLLARATALLVLILSFACGPAPQGEDDSGVVEPADAGGGAGEDAGMVEDAGVDAGPPPRPNTIIQSRPADFTNATTATFTFTATVAGRSFECRLDDAGFGACSSPAAYPGLNDGEHTFEVRALNVDLLPDETPDFDGFIVDTLPPQTTIDSAPAPSLSEPRATVVFSCDEPPCTFECALDAAAFAPCKSPRTFEGLSSGAHALELRAIDRAGNLDATPATAAFSVNAGVETVRIMAANTTSGNFQSYDPGEGQRIFQGLKPDVVLIQEFNYGDKSPEAIRGFVDTVFGAQFVYFREGAQIPNGIISRYPIVTSGVWDDPLVTNREFAWAQIDLPGPRDLWAVSVHLLSTSASSRTSEANALASFIQANVPAGALLAVGGDFNTNTRNESCIAALAQVVLTSPSVSPYPVDQAGNSNTNASREKPYDWLLVDGDLNALITPVVIGANSFGPGLVFDSRVYTPLSDVAPVLSSDSAGPAMQHMAVVKDFNVAY